MSGRPWLVSARWDLSVIALPALATVALALALPTASVSALGWVVLVLCVDVAHVYASLYRTYLDAEELGRHPWRYAGTPLAVVVGGIALYRAWPEGYWTVLAYIAVFHFVRQQVGFTALYRLVEGAPARDLGARVERALVYALTLYPVLWWHAHLPRGFSWFMPGDFVAGLPRAALVPAGALTAGLLVAHLALRLRSGRAAWGRDLWVGLTGLCWFTGIVFTNGDLAFTATNVVLHGVPYIALCGVVARRQWAATGRGPAWQAWFGAAPLFVLPLLVLAFVEEGLWDQLVWHDNAWLFGESAGGAGWASWAVPLLSAPQVTHYLLDALIWRMGGADAAHPHNPGLRGWVRGEPAPAGELSPSSG